jgi:aldehyde dehydrogenase (NAD+)
VENKSKEELETLFRKQQEYFRTGVTRDIKFRAKALKKYRDAIWRHKDDLYKALWEDLHKSPTESYFSEVHSATSEVDFALKNLSAWTKPQRIPHPVFFPLSKGYVATEPFGAVLLMTPFNYPVSINLAILASAIAAGNCIMVKPSEKPKASLEVINTIIKETFSEEYATLVIADPKTTRELLLFPFGSIFFIGSTPVGRIVMEAAAKNLTPVSLGLGGKCPAIVDKNVALDTAAKRIVWGKFLNAGQVCIGIDYILAHKDIKEQLIERMKFYIKEFYGADAKISPNYGRLIDVGQFDRISSFIHQGKVRAGGATDRDQRYIEPTIIDEVPVDALAAREEIFGPVLPVFEFENSDGALRHVQNLPPPLGMYIFSNDRSFQSTLMDNAISGSVCINDAIVQDSSGYTPQGGVGMSGFGRAHGKYAFESFSYKRMILRQPTFFDAMGRFPPYSDKLLPFIEKLFR